MLTLIGFLALGAGGTTLFGAVKASKGEFEMDKTFKLGSLKLRVIMDKDDPLIFSLDREN
ncbi:MAG: hypothetical protein PHY47_00865 [Lachnospiraceae bacterium]|nr:hypothetical protein [Lachnospiraceae bacterium]